MNFIRMATNNLLKQIKSYYLFILTIAVSTAVIFNAMNTTMNEEIMIGLGEYSTMLSLLAFFLVFTSVLMSGYVSYYFITSKTKEVGVIGISGGSVIHTALYLSIQNILIEIIGAVIGLVVGLAISPLYNLVVKSNLNIDGGANISSAAIKLTLGWIFIQACYALTVGIGYAYRKTIRELMVEENTALAEDKRLLRIPSGFYIFLYVLGIIFMYLIGGTEGGNVSAYIVVISVAGASGILKYSLPKYLSKQRKKGKLYKKGKMIWTGNLSVLLTRTSLLLVTMMLGIVAIISLVIFNNANYEITFMLNLQLVTFLILISLAIIYKLSAEIFGRKDSFYHLNIMGYTKAEIEDTIKKEIIAYFIIFVLLALLPVIATIIASIIRGTITVGNAIGLILPSLMVITLVAVISYIGYKKIIFKRI